MNGDISSNSFMPFKFVSYLDDIDTLCHDGWDKQHFPLYNYRYALCKEVNHAHTWSLQRESHLVCQVYTNLK